MAPASILPPHRTDGHRLHRLGLLLSLLSLCTAAVAATATGPLQGARQLVLVTTASWDANQGTLHRYEREGELAPWVEVGAFPVAIGRNGSAWGTGLHAATDLDDGPVKREGDGRSPAGAFALGEAFGYAGRGEGGLPYAQMQASHWCMDVPRSPHYNRIVDADQVGQAAVAGSSEPMRLDLHKDGDPRYRLGFVIENNPGNVPGDGSCIFAHLWRKPGETTAGCTAMGDQDMQDLLQWLDPARQPRFVLLPRAEHERLALAWDLPAPMEVAP